MWLDNRRDVCRAVDAMESIYSNPATESSQSYKVQRFQQGSGFNKCSIASDRGREVGTLEIMMINDRTGEIEGF